MASDGAGRQSHSLRSFNFGSFPHNATYTNVRGNGEKSMKQKRESLRLVYEEQDKSPGLNQIFWARSAWASVDAVFHHYWNSYRVGRSDYGFARLFNSLLWYIGGTMEDKITIIEGPPPVFEAVNDGWALGLNESSRLSVPALTRLRTFNGPALVERCYRAWNAKNADASALPERYGRGTGCTNLCGSQCGHPRRACSAVMGLPRPWEGRIRVRLRGWRVWRKQSWIKTKDRACARSFVHFAYYSYDDCL